MTHGKQSCFWMRALKSNIYFLTQKFTIHLLSLYKFSSRTNTIFHSEVKKKKKVFNMGFVFPQSHVLISRKLCESHQPWYQKCSARSSTLDGLINMTYFSDIDNVHVHIWMLHLHECLFFSKCFHYSSKSFYQSL